MSQKVLGKRLGQNQSYVSRLESGGGQGHHGRLTTAQRTWIAALEQCPGVEAYVWRPAGMTWWYRQYAKGDVTLAQLEAEAKAPKRGPWRDTHATTPWAF